MCPENLDTEGYPQPRSLKTCSTVLTAYNGERIIQYGTMSLPCTHRDVKCDAEFYVADTPGPAIMGLPSCRALRLVTMNCEISNNKHDSPQHEIPTRPWQIVGTDLFVVNRDNYLIICDYYSKFPFVYKIEGQVTSDAVIHRMKGVFAEQGCPTRVVSDNGGHYSSFAFRKYTFAQFRSHFEYLN